MKIAYLLVGLVGLISCGSDKDSDPLGSASGFCAEWAKRACTEAVVTSCEADDKQACQSTQAQFCEKLVPDALYSKAGADKCLKAVEAAYKDGDLSADERDTVRSLGAPCDEVLSGDGQANDACNESSDCDRTAGLDCLIPLGEQYGKCQKPHKVTGGLPCDGADDVCAEGFYCADSDGEQNCLARKNAGKACSDTVPCAEGLKCEPAGDGGQGSLCKAKLAKNERGCETDSDCATGICLASKTASVCASFISLGPLEDICEDLH
ncbi:MAG TPA: hypothetical protein VHM70_22750 [Polyangiaceae bacterium]|nr:hypothetical protein [Polyangiaceae bacterium]